MTVGMRIRIPSLFVAALAVLAVLTGCGSSATTVEVGSPTFEQPDAGSPATEPTGDSETAVAPATPPGDAAEGSLVISTDAAALASSVTGSTYRAELAFTMRVSDGGVSLDLGDEEPAVFIEQRGANSHTTLDFASTFEALVAMMPADEATQALGALGEGDLTMEMIIVDGTGYLRAPFFETVLNASGAGGEAFDPAQLGPAGGLLQLGDGWGSFDLTAIPGVDPEALAQMVGGMSGGNTSQLLDLLEAAGTVDVVGQAEVRGVTATQYRGSVAFGDVLASSSASGQITSMLGEQAESLLGIEVPIDVFVDPDGRLRRIEYTMDMASLFATVPDAGDLADDATLVIGASLDFFDFDDPGIAIEAPPADQIVADLTDDFAAIAELTAQQGG